MLRFLIGMLSVVILCGFTSGGESDTYDGFFVVGKGQQRFTEIFQKGLEPGYFYYEELTRNLLEEFEGIPYGAGNVSCPSDQTLINFESFDCVTFVETWYAIAATLHEYQKQSKSFSRDPFLDFGSHLNRIRYFGGENCGMQDRIHYFTQELEELARSGHAFNIAMANGNRYYKKINYISANGDKYGNLAQSRQTQKLESILSRTPRFYYPLSKRENYFPMAQDGDIIAFSAKEDGLDVSHCGIVTIVDGRPALNHASAKANKVIIGQDLEYYIRSRTRINGFFVYRPVFD